MDKPKKTSSATAETDTSATAPSPSSSEERGFPPEKGRVSGAMLQELLQQESRILRLTACKVDQLAPAVTVTSSEKSMQYLKRFEQLL
ncbi:hypothetical protein GCK32_003448 [Trichostrongylus colubriformis]|uniref:Uncharacterized protein n=1 Tax=Trichostrongylus colubriformis TaxID=6319 RepID=A0AAN8IU77_TRICO